MQITGIYTVNSTPQRAKAAPAPNFKRVSGNVSSTKLTYSPPPASEGKNSGTPSGPGGGYAPGGYGSSGYRTGGYAPGYGGYGVNGGYGAYGPYGYWSTSFSTYQYPGGRDPYYYYSENYNTSARDPYSYYSESYPNRGNDPYYYYYDSYRRP